MSGRQKKKREGEREERLGRKESNSRVDRPVDERKIEGERKERERERGERERQRVRERAREGKNEKER